MYICRWIKSTSRFLKWQSAVTFTTFVMTLAIRTRRSAIWNSRDACINFAIRTRLPALPSSTHVKLQQRSFSREQPHWVARAFWMLRKRLAIVVAINGAKIKSQRNRRRPAENYNVEHEKNKGQYNIYLYL